MVLGTVSKLEAQAVARIEAENERRAAAGEPLLTADHYTVEGCLVDPGGVARAPGEVHDIQLEREGGESEVLDAVERARSTIFQSVPRLSSSRRGSRHDRRGYGRSSSAPRV